MTTRHRIDLDAVRAARASLRKLVAERPELRGESSAENRAGWEATLEDAMAENSEQIVVRIPKPLAKRLDAHVEAMKKEQPGMTITRSDAVRMFIVRCLDDAESKRGKR
jgi:hypothetical protein